MCSGVAIVMLLFINGNTRYDVIPVRSKTEIVEFIKNINVYKGHKLLRQGIATLTLFDYKKTKKYNCGQLRKAF